MTTNRIRVLFESVGAAKVARELNLIKNGSKDLQKSQEQFSRGTGVKVSEEDALAMMGFNPKTISGIDKYKSDLFQQMKALEAMPAPQVKAMTGLDSKQEALAQLAAQHQFAVRDIIGADKRATRSMKGFRMEYLSLMFFGMQVWRSFSTIFKGMIAEYKKLDSKGQKPLTRSLTKLSASFTFLKFSIMDAMGPSMTVFINFLASAALWVAQLNPSWLVAIGVAIGTIATVGLAFFMGAQVALFANAMTDILTMSKINPKKFDALSTSIGKVGSSLKSVVGRTLLLGVSFYFAASAINQFKQGDILGGIADALIAGGSLLALKMAGPGGMVIAIGAMLKFYDYLQDKETQRAFRSIRRAVQTLFNELEVMGKELSLGDFQEVMEEHIRSLDVPQIQAQYDDMMDQLDLGLMDDEQFRQSVGYLLGTKEGDVEGFEEGKGPVDKIFDIDEDAAGLTEFSKMTIGAFTKLNESTAQIINDVTAPALNDMSVLAGATMQTELIDRLEDWDPDKTVTLTVKVKYEEGDDDTRQLPTIASGFVKDVKEELSQLFTPNPTY